MMKYLIGASVALARVGAAKECDLVCAMIYSVDPESCACVPIEWMECHP